MRILYLAYAPHNTPRSYRNYSKTGCSWIDALLEEILKYRNINIALGVPVNEKKLQKHQQEKFTFYGLPNPQEKNIFLKAFNRLTYSIENVQINDYVSQVIEDFNPDVIQVFGSEGPFGLVTKQKSIPVIIHIQGYLFVCLGKWFAGLSKWQQFRYTSLKSILFMQGPIHEYIIFKKKVDREAIILKNCKYYMGRTNFDKRIASLISPNSTYFHCEEFIRKIFFEKLWNFPLENSIKLISILKSASYKGIELLVETLIILKKYTSYSFELNICGVSEEDEIVKLLKKKFKKQINLSSIRFQGKLSSSELINQLCNSNFYIHPSYIENSPNSICEAMALGMPIISTNVGGVASLMDDKIEGLLVQEGESYSLAGAILELMNNYEYAILLGKNARKRAIRRHDPKETGKRLIEIYKSILLEK